MLRAAVGSAPSAGGRRLAISFPSTVAGSPQAELPQDAPKFPHAECRVTRTAPRRPLAPGTEDPMARLETGEGGKGIIHDMCAKAARKNTPQYPPGA